MLIPPLFPDPDIERLALAVIVAVGIAGLGWSGLKTDRIIL